MGRNKKFKEVNEKTTQLYDRITKLEAQILDKVILIRKQQNKVQSLCQHLDFSQGEIKYDEKCNYYQMFWKLFLIIQINQDKVEKAAEQNRLLQKDMLWVQRKFIKYQELVNYRGMNRQFKLPAEEFVCDVSGCDKIYQTEEALGLHQKIKHSKDFYNKKNHQMRSQSYLKSEMQE